MNTIRVSATKARNNFFDLLNQVASGVEVIIKKDNKEIAVMSQKKTKTDWDALMKATEASAGIWKDDPIDNPLRKPGAWGDFGNWDKGINWKKLKKKR